MTKTVLSREQNGVLSLSLNRPDVRNAFSGEMISELTTIFRQAAVRKDLRVIHLRGEGKVFCAGADMNYMREMVNFPFEKNRSEALVLHDMFESVFSCPLPVVVQVHGAVFGGALGLCAAADIVLAEEKTQFCFSEVKLGLAPAVISDFVLRKTNLGVCAPWMLTGQVFSLKEAMQMNLTHVSVPSSDLDGVTATWLRSFAMAGPEAVRETKKLIQSLPRHSREEARSETARVISERRVSPEGQEGLKAFLEKRSPSWRQE